MDVGILGRVSLSRCLEFKVRETIVILEFDQLPHTKELFIIFSQKPFLFSLKNITDPHYILAISDFNIPLLKKLCQKRRLKQVFKY